MNNAQISLSWGKDYNYLAIQKCRNKILYKYLKEHGLPKYQEETTNTLLDLGDMYYYLVEGRMMSRFFRDKMRDLYVSAASFGIVIPKLAFDLRTSEVPYEQWQKMKLILERFEQWKKEFVMNAECQNS